MEMSDQTAQLNSSLLMASLRDFQDAQYQDIGLLGDDDELPSLMMIPPSLSSPLPLSSSVCIEDREVPDTPVKPKKRDRSTSPTESIAETTQSSSRYSTDLRNDNVRRCLTFEGVTDAYYYQDPPLGIALTQPAPLTQETEEDDEVMEHHPESLSLQEAYNELVVHKKCSKKAALQGGIHGLSGAVLTLLKGEERAALHQIRTMERLMRTCLQLRFRLKIRKSSTKRKVPASDVEEDQDQVDPTETREVMLPTLLNKKIKTEEEEERELFSDSESVEEISAEDDH